MRFGSARWCRSRPTRRASPSCSAIGLAVVRLAILVSGRGSNLEAVLEAAVDGRLPTVQPVLVVSNRPGVRALQVAARHGIPTAVLPRAAFPDASARDAAIGAAVAGSGADLAL